MSEDGESSRSQDEESLDDGAHMVELIYYNVPGRTDRSRRGKAYRNRSDGELRCFEAHDGVKYRPGDHVYVESGSNDPFIIGSIGQFKMNKRESLSVKVTRFFRPEEVPDMSISVILQERNELVEEGEPIVETHSRELFASESSQSYPISCLRGKCEVSFVKDFRSLDGCDLNKCDSFFSCLAYNQESLRLAAVQGEIRVGGAFQAKLPPEATCNVGDEPDRDELVYRPGQISEQTEHKYIQLARSFRMFAMMGDSKIQSVEKNARVSDLLFDDSLATLHRCGYKYNDALKEMNTNDKLLLCDANFMTQDDIKKFSKGIRTYGKNFLRINRELLPMHSRDQLVAFYYLWKKTPEATKPKPLTRPRNPVAAVKKAKNGNKASRPASTEYNDYASASESDVEEGKGTHYACHHCYSSDSKDWHHAGRDGLLLCTDCRLFFKKYGQLRPVDRPSTVPPTLFKRSPTGSDHEEEGVRTRAGKNNRRRTPSMGDERRSPSQAVSIHEFDMEKISKHKNGKRKRSHVNGSAKKKKMEEKDVTPPVEEKDDKPESSSTSASDSTHSSPPVKEEPMEIGLENGFHDEIKEEKPNIKEPIVMAVEPSTSRCCEVVVVKSEEDVDVEGDYYDPSEDNSWQQGTEPALETKNAIFVRGTVRAVGHRCSRTDFYYRIKPGGAWDEAIKKREEKQRNPPPPVVSVAAPIMPIKKPEINGITADNRMSTMAEQTMLMQMMAQLQQQAQHAQAQAQAHAQAQAQAHQMQILEQQQQAVVKQLEMQRHQQQQMQALMQQREAASRMIPQAFLDQRMAAMMPQMAPGMHPANMMEMMAHAAQMQQMQAQLQLAAASAAPQAAMMTPEIQQQMLLQNPHLMQQIMQQQQQQAIAAAMGHPMAVGSDMMRRLQQEGHRSFPQ